MLAFAAAMAQAPASTKLGSIKGRVLSDGQAVTNATVSVSSVNSPSQTRGVPTNDNGDFEVKGLDSGVYRVRVSAPAYVSVPAEPEQEIHRVGDSVTLNMIKGGVITGKIVTSDDDPVVGVRVSALMIRDSSGNRPTLAVPSPARHTDDRGVYRIFGLVPGTYIVFAGGRGFSGTGANAYDNDAPTFAPSATRDTAEELSLAAGEERTIDIRYRGTDGHAVSGNVTVPATADAPWISINLDRVVKSNLDFRMSTYQRAGVKGFDLHGVADGDYFIWAEYHSGERLLSEPKRITVKGADVSGLELIVKPLASVAGVVVLEPSTIAECKDKRRPLFEETLVSIQRSQAQLYSNSSQVSADAVGRFQLRNLAEGQYNFNIRTLAPYWYLRSLILPGPNDSNDLARNLFRLKSGDRVTGLKATLAEGAMVSGQVELAEDRRSDRIIFYLIPAEKDDVLRYFAVAVAEVGTFTLDHVPPGRYWTLAKALTTEKEVSTPELRLPTSASTRARLRREAEAVRSDLELKPCQNVKNHRLPLASN
jgi:hypothetical protein